MKTIQFHIKKLNKSQFETLTNMCYASRKLYNSAIYICRKFYEETTSYIGYMGLYNELKSSEHYKSLPSKIAQQILRLVDKNYMSFFALLKAKRNGNYNDSVHPPKFKPKGSKFNLILPCDQVSWKKGLLKITKDIKIPFNYSNLEGKKIKQAIIQPSQYDNKYFTLYLSYEEPLPDLKSSNGRFLSLDLGINNLVSCFSNVGPSFIMNGKPLKAYNQFYNKRKSHIQEELMRCNRKYYSKKLDKITSDRKNWINNYFNQTISYIIKFCKQYDIREIVCGYNKEWKQEINLGKKTNQKFMDIPYWTFKRKLSDKCKSEGIGFEVQEESYTSKCSFLDNEIVGKKDQYQGKRVKRGLFRTSTGILCNADINGAANILKKKVVSKGGSLELSEGIEDHIVGPRKLASAFACANL